MRWRRDSNEHQRSAPLRRHHRPGDHRKGDHGVRAQQGDVQGRQATPPSRRSRKRSRSCSTSRSRASTRSSAGQGESVPQQDRAAVRRQARDRDPRRGSQDRRDHGLVRERCDGIENLQSDHAGPAPAGDRRPLGAVQGRAGQVVDRRPELDRRPQQQRPHHLAFPRRRPQAGLSADRFPPHASSTCRRRSSASNTIRTAPPSSR